jgi:diguanylate cyclase (GGDEF)-like protein
MLATLVVVRPRVPGASVALLVIVGAVVVITPLIVNVWCARGSRVREPIPNRRDLFGLVSDALVMLTFVALFCLSDPRTDAFALLLLPQLQMATTRRPSLMATTGVLSCASLVALEVYAARLHGSAVPWPTIAARVALLTVGAVVLWRIAHILGVHIAALRELHRVVAHQALHDPLTSLPNRALFFERVRIALARQQRSGVRFAVVFVDLDDLKIVNDTLGHSAGDELLRVTAERLRDELRATDTPARLGGDEFAALLDDPGGDENLEDLTRRLLDRLGQPISTPALHLRTSVSIGVATSEHITSADELIQRADFAMYRAKAEGKGRVVHFDVDDSTDISELDL